MNPEQPSRTALATACARAAHLIVDDHPPIFADVLASAILGKHAEEPIKRHRAHGAHIGLWGTRALTTVRSRYTEDSLAQSVGRGVTQYVILGAGLDSFAYRSELAQQIQVFEVDYPPTQQLKRQLLAEAQIPVPEWVTFVPVDFEIDVLTDRLVSTGFSLSQPALVSWLGVTMYLTRPAIGQTLAEIGRFAPGTELILNYMLPEDLRDPDARSYADVVMPLAAQQGEPWLTFLAPVEMSAILSGHGFGLTKHVSQREAVDAALWERSDSLRPLNLSNLAHATVG